MTDESISIDTGTDELLCAIRNRVAVITLNRPEARNSLSDHLTPALGRMIKRSGDDPDVGALLITGAGSAFCSGGDVKGMGGSSAAPAMSFSDKVAQLKEAGAGLAIALACDIRIAGESTIILTGYARIALTGDYGISWLLTRLAGTARARELMFLSERIDARCCEAFGLVNRVVPDVDLQNEAFGIARTLANGRGSAFASIKDNLDLALSADFLTSLDHEAEKMVLAASTAQHTEAVRAFIEKRAPSYR